MVSPGPDRNTTEQTGANKLALNEIDWDTRLVRRASAISTMLLPSSETAMLNGFFIKKNPSCKESPWQAVEQKCSLLRGVNSMDKPNGRLVLVSYTHCCASTSSLSTRWSFWALQGDLILGRASRLYAFSGYHNRTSLPSRAIGMTTGTQEVRPSRSSRTKDSPPQISYAHSR